jgi:hypothetical protein
LGTAIANLAGGSKAWLAKGGSRVGMGGGKKRADTCRGGGYSKPLLDEDLRQMCQQFFVQVRARVSS